MTESVTISLERYEALKNMEAAELAKAEALKFNEEILSNINDMFSLYENYKDEVVLAININKAKEIFKALFTVSKYSETHQIATGWDYKETSTANVAEYYVLAKKICEEDQTDEQ